MMTAELEFNGFACSTKFAKHHNLCNLKLVYSNNTEIKMIKERYCGASDLIAVVKLTILPDCTLQSVKLVLMFSNMH